MMKDEEAPAAAMALRAKSYISAPLEKFYMFQESNREKIATTARVLTEARIAYALVGGNAVAHYVFEADPAAVRSTFNVGILLERASLEPTKTAMQDAGFIYRHSAGVHMFMDGPSARNAVHAIMAGEKVRPEYATAAPHLDAVTITEEGLAVIPLSKLVEMKLNSYRLKDRLHLLDMIDVGLLPGDVMAALHPQLAERLQALVDNPDQ